MKRLLFALAGGAVMSSAFAGSTLVFDNMGAETLAHKNSYQHSYAPGVITNGSTNERGFVVTPAGGATVLTGMMGSYISYITDTIPSGTETFRVRLYAEDGAVTSSGAPNNYSRNAPGTILYDSGQVPVHLFGSQYFVMNLPNVAVPASFAYLCKPENYDQSIHTWGQGLCGPPTTGTGLNALWRRNDPVGSPLGWQLVSLATYNGGPPTGVYGNIYGSMAGRFWAKGNPSEPYNANINPYQDWDTNVTGTVWYDPEATDVGDDVTLEGWRRTSTGMDITYIPDVTAPTGTESVTVNIYPWVANSASGALSDSVPDVTPLATATALIPDMTAAAHVMTIPFSSSVTLPDKFVYTLTWNNVGQIAGNAVGPVIADQASTGGSEVAGMWENVGGVWDEPWFGQPWYDNATWGDATAGTYNNIYANYMAKFNFVATPLKVNADAVVASTGTIYAGTLADATGVNAAYLEVRPGVVFSNAFDPAILDFTTHLPCNDPTSLNCVLSVHASAGRVRLRTKLPAYPGGTFTTGGTPGDPTFYDGTTVPLSLPFGASPAAVVTIPIPVANIGDISTRFETKIRLQFRAMSAVFSFPWRGQVDDIHWDYMP